MRRSGNGTDIRTRFEQMRGEAVAQGVASCGLVDAGTAHGRLHGSLQDSLMKVMTTFAATAWIEASLRCGKDVLPHPLARRTDILSIERVG